MHPKDARVDIKTTKAAKELLEHAAQLLGTTLSAFIIDSAITKARKIVAQSEMIDLTRSEAERFIAELEHPSKPNEKLKQLFKQYRNK